MNSLSRIHNSHFMVNLAYCCRQSFLTAPPLEYFKAHSRPHILTTNILLSISWRWSLFYFYLFIIYLCLSSIKTSSWMFLLIFLERKDGRERGREGYIDVKETHRSVTSCICPSQGSNPPPGYVSWAGIKPTTFLVYGMVL